MQLKYLLMASLPLRKPLAFAVSVTTLMLVVSCGGAAILDPSPSASQTVVPDELTPPAPQTVAPKEPAPPAPQTVAQTVAPKESSSSPELPGLALERVFEGLPFSRLTNLVQMGSRLFVTEQTGRVMAFPSGPEASEAAVFLDIRDRVSDAGNEEGLLGLAFDPDFDSNGHFYVYYSAANPRRSVVSQFTAETSSAVAVETETELVVMEVPQPYQNHNGGQLSFGPDGMLYISLGDGGLGGDPRSNGQNPATLLGSILRIDVSGAGPDAGPDNRYRVPPDNPFVASPGARDEIWAYGFRNPWRFSFDRQTGDLWAADVGQNSYEEVDLVVRGGNYGWNILEGGHCFSPRSGCDPSGTRLPVIEYSTNKGCSVIGGYVYRGTRIPSLAGAYLYGDFCSGEVHGFRYGNNEVIGHALLIDSGLMITSFGEDSDGEIYVLSQEGGIYMLKADG